MKVLVRKNEERGEVVAEEAPPSAWRLSYHRSKYQTDPNDRLRFYRLTSFPRQLGLGLGPVC